jgi:hypothetical protein
LYDRVVIPTYDFGIVPALASWLGPPSFLQLLHSRSIAFIRRRGLLGYVGNGNGISTFGIQAGASKPLPWSMEALFAPPEEALHLQLQAAPAAVKALQSEADLIIGSVLPFDYANDQFMHNVVHESYTDLMKSPRLSRMVMARTQKRPDGSVDLTWLPQVRGDQLRLLTAEGAIDDPIDLVLRVAEVNFELWMASQASQADLFTAADADELLKDKLLRSGATPNALEGFLHLLDLSNLPDIGAAIAAGELSLSQVVELRDRPHSRDFRKWLRKADAKDARELERAYVEAISMPSLTDRLPVRAARFVITSIAGLLLPVLGGIAASAVDSFFVDRWLKGYSPSLLMDDIRRLQIPLRKHVH